MSAPTPPRWADRFLHWFCSEELIEEIQGDLHEAYQHRCEKHGQQQADRRYVADVFTFFKPYAFERYSRAKQFLPMVDNYFKIAFRNILHRKGFTAINIIGLTFGLSAVVLIGLYLRHELTYDQDTPDHERIHRLVNNYRDQTYTCMPFNDYNDSDQAAQLGLVRHLEEDDQVVAACHFVPSRSSIGGNEKVFVASVGKRFVVDNILYTNTGLAFQSVFPQQFLLGSAAEAFGQPNTLILTEEIAERWFGWDWQQQQLIGKPLTIQEEAYTLAGVVANPPDNQHYTFEVIAHQDRIPSWGAYTYYKLQADADNQAFIAQLNKEVDLFYPGYTEDVLSKGIASVPLTQIHFTPDMLYELKPVANPTYLLTFGLVGLILLLIIWTNYTNLSVAMYADRQRELGMRKVLGARPQDISFQLLSEAVCLAFLCLPLIGIVAFTFLPYFNELMGIALPTSVLYSGSTVLALLGLLLLTGLLSGLYPALAYGHRSMLRLFGARTGNTRVSRFWNFRNSLVTLQFVLVIGLLSLTYFIYQQMNYINTFDLGYERKGILYFGVDGAEKYQQLATAFEQLPEVLSVGANGVPGSEMYNQLTYKMKDTETVLSDGSEQYLSLGAIETLGIDCGPCDALRAGKESIFVINRTAAEKLARVKGVAPDDLIGEVLVTEPEWENEEFGYGVPHIIDGIIADYQFFSLKYESQPLLISIVAEPGWVYEMLVNVKSKDWPSTLSRLETTYAAIETERPFDFTFLEDRLAQLYEAEKRSGILMAVLGIVAVVLAMMGLAGVVAYLAFRRQKEIGIRRIHGASMRDILFTFNKEFVVLLGMATLIALPITLFLASQWLKSFVFGIQPRFWVVLLAGLATLVLIIIVVSTQARRAAFKSPVEVLRAD